MISIFTEEEIELLTELLNMHIDNSRDENDDDYNEQVRIVNNIYKKLTGEDNRFERTYEWDDD
jgi:hypothetical protein